MHIQISTITVSNIKIFFLTLNCNIVISFAALQREKTQLSHKNLIRCYVSKTVAYLSNKIMIHKTNFKH